MESLGDAAAKKVRKPYTISKSRESWTDEEHDKFIEALQLFDRDWKKIEDFIGSKTVIQIRSHAQKYFLKVQKNGAVAHVPPPRPKRKATHPYPQKAPKNVLMPLQASVAYPSASVDTLAARYATWDDASVLVHHATAGDMTSECEYDILFDEVDIEPGALPNSESRNQEKQDYVIHGIPDFAEVYSFIGSIFDPGSRDHVQKLKEMDPINFETVLMLMKNLTINLSSPDFEPIQSITDSLCWS